MDHSFKQLNHDCSVLSILSIIQFLSEDLESLDWPILSTYRVLGHCTEESFNAVAVTLTRNRQDPDEM